MLKKNNKKDKYIYIYRERERERMLTNQVGINYVLQKNIYLYSLDENPMTSTYIFLLL